MQDWHLRLEASTRARFYNTFAQFIYQNYFDIIYIEKLRTKKYMEGLGILRLSSHRLEVEIGRWAKPTAILFENRKCILCGNVEDEYHFVIE